ncbi:Cyclin-dependent kinase inhibitor 1-like [Heracleum sosnowskyi]|uniref:Cyclin-dependent kinase inhibitor 1-like n=1 Tax=Heracleum sosnowskyi TaxID=360622 RepID=A0AAD8IE17_9APIA|nr:Cyclin-dependent kinase inhibitor 1-like [Heracleum sosnowskyi]
MIIIFIDFLKLLHVIFSFFFALIVGVIKSILVGPFAALILIIGNSVVILGLLPAHVTWTVYTLFKTKRFDSLLKVALLFALPVLFGIWVALGIVSSVLIGLGYGFLNPWISAFEAFRHEESSECQKFFHCLVDGTWETITGSGTGVRDFGDMCYHSYPVYLKEFRESTGSHDPQPLRLIHIPGCIIVGILGLLVEIPMYTAIAIVKSPYLLFKGWQRLTHDLFHREGLFLETGCIPVAGLSIIAWPIIVVGHIATAILSSIFIGLYGTVIVYQERSFQRGLAYIIAMVSEFDEYTNDWLYLREGSIIPKPRYRKRTSPYSDPSNHTISIGSVIKEAPPVLMENMSPFRSVGETINEVKMVQVWGNIMRSKELRGKELLDANLITVADLYDWLNAKNSEEGAIIGIGLPSYCFYYMIVNSIRAGSAGIMILDDLVVNDQNRPQDKLVDWFYQPVMVLKEQIRGIEENELKYLEKYLLFGADPNRMMAWDNGSSIPQDAVKVAQLGGIARRMVGLVKSTSKFPTYRRRFRQVVKSLVIHELAKEAGSTGQGTNSPASGVTGQETSTQASVKLGASDELV